MATRSSYRGSSEPGIIILGNAGAGKSFICNILVGYERFKADFQPEAVTTETEYDWVTIGSKSFRIFNIPGLVEINQKSIDRNKKEIMKAFDQSPISVVIFVWTHVGGRMQQDDIIAFESLNKAYEFPLGSLMFVVNNIPTGRPPDYEAKYLTALTNTLKSMPVAMDSIFFLEQMNFDDKQNINVACSRLMVFIDHHHASLQQKHADIILQSDQLKKMRELVKKQQLEAERDREVFQNQIQEMTKDYQIAKKEAEQRYELMQAKLETVRMNAEKELAAQEAERRNWRRQQREQEERYRQQLAAQEAERRNWERQLQQQREREEQDRQVREEQEREAQNRREPDLKPEYWRMGRNCRCVCHKSPGISHAVPCCLASGQVWGRPGSCAPM